MSARGLNLLVFRAGCRRLHGPDLKAQLLIVLESLAASPSTDDVLNALLRAGELECGTADAEADNLPFAKLTDSLAEALLRSRPPSHFQSIIEAVRCAPVPELLDLSTPEGFAYYALHPLAYAQALDKLPSLPGHVVVVGIRSIGTTLSAMTAAAAGLRGADVVRMTVRPGGHPYNRQTEFSSPKKAVIQNAILRDAQFLVVDEGPGLSGSSFLSVAEALERAGAAREKIVLICGHEPNLESLCSANAAGRWRCFRAVAAAGEPHRPKEAEVFIGGGGWRKLLFVSNSQWPDSWTSMERLKYLSAAEPRRLFKFTGLGHYTNPIFEREQAIAAAGFGPPPQQESDGFISYPWLKGRPASADDLSPDVLTRLAEYCAFRANAFVAFDVDLAPLQEMAEHNFAQLGVNLSLALQLQRPVIADGRMQPHEWIFTGAGEMLKTDSGSHGDDHFFPGSTDIGWDLAGAMVEWRMTREQATEFLDQYRRISGDDARARVDDFIRAYIVFRWAYCKMAANAIQGAPEQASLEAAAESYAAMLPAMRAASGF
jgi:hypothetical protein